jgi:hypothetical protein
LKIADLWAGILFIVAGSVGLWIARAYPAGTVAQMGPGFFPRVICGALILIGLIVALGALRNADSAERIGVWPWRAIAMVLGGMFLFGILAPRFGLIVGGAVVIVMSGFATRDVRPLELLVFTAALVAAVVVVFVYGLGLDLPVLPVD